MFLAHNYCHYRRGERSYAPCRSARNHRPGIRSKSPAPSRPRSSHAETSCGSLLAELDGCFNRLEFVRDYAHHHPPAAVNSMHPRSSAKSMPILTFILDIPRYSAADGHDTILACHRGRLENGFSPSTDFESRFPIAPTRDDLQTENSSPVLSARCLSRQWGNQLASKNSPMEDILRGQMNNAIVSAISRTTARSVAATTLISTTGPSARYAEDVALMKGVLADCDLLIAGAGKIGGISYFDDYAT